MTQKVYIDWNYVEKACKELAGMVKKEKIEVIVAITKGGLPLATIMANKYLNNPPIITVQLKETTHRTQKANYEAKRVDLISPGVIPWTTTSFEHSFENYGEKYIGFPLYWRDERFLEWFLQRKNEWFRSQAEIARQVESSRLV